MIVVSVTTDLDVPSELDHIAIEVAREGPPTLRSVVLDGDTAFPLTLGLLRGSGPLGPVVVDVVGSKDERPVVMRQARLDFIAGEQVTLHIELLRECIDNDCAPRTCARGGCREVQIDPRELLPGEFDGGTCGAERCNGIDDDCDTRVDEGADGTCMGPRVTAARCEEGACEIECVAGSLDCDPTVAGCETDADTETDCGGCGITCDRPRAATECAAGSCRVLACESGYHDCDLDPDNGCESDLRDVTNCGGCGIPCALLNGTAACGSGRCELVSCEPGWDNCDGRPENGCEANVSADIFNCGGCGRECAHDAPNAFDVCVDGECEIGCNPGWDNCDRVAMNGCETDLSAPENCGLCGLRCSGVEFLCSGRPGTYECIPPPCMDPPTRCGPLCVDTETNPQHCGGCDSVCPARANAAPTCVASGCGFTCDPGYGDCDGMVGNGCETPLNTSTSCGACGRACILDTATAVCIGGNCAIASCDAGWGDCDFVATNGCETDLRDATNCGGCGVVCSLPNATTDCAGGACSIALCDVGWEDCDGVHGNGCETPSAACDTCGLQVRQRLSFLNSAQDEALMDFPVLVVLDPTNFDYIKAQPDGADLRFTDPDGTVLPHEIEVWNEGGESFVWVRVPQIEANSDSDFVWMIYGNPDALDRQDPATLWSEYEAVYHLTNLSDSTTRLADAIDNGTDAASALAGARLFDSDDYLDLGNDVALLQSVPEWTISAWIRNTEISTTQSVVSVSIFNGGSATATSRASLQIQSGELRGGARSNETEPQQVADSVAGGLMNDRWHCIAATTHYPTDTISVFIDGVRNTRATVDCAEDATMPEPPAVSAIGAQDNGMGQHFRGVIDEVRISPVARSEAWLAAECLVLNRSFVVVASAEPAIAPVCP